jgi:hypothetical protein
MKNNAPETEEKRYPLPWVTRFLFRLSPILGTRSLLRLLNFDVKLIDRANDLFLNAETIDIHPVKSSSRGFVLTLNREISFFFYQNGGSFAYDGFEVGEYEPGDVHIFDKIK